MGALDIPACAAMMVVCDAAGRLRLAERRDREGDWGFLGGRVELGESARDAAVREAWEEARILVDECREIYREGGTVTFEAVAWRQDVGEGDCITKWGTWEEAIAGCFGEYNRSVRRAMGLDRR